MKIPGNDKDPIGSLATSTFDGETIHHEGTNI
jgi:hypothetical protein